MSRLLVITGLPATGKSTVARFLARRWAAPLIAKDTIKEPLLDVLGAPEATASRALSDASFAVLFALARELVTAGVSLVLEGNFRPVEHSAPLRDLVVGSRARGRAPGELVERTANRRDEHAAMSTAAPALCAQLLCRLDEPLRLRLLAARASDPARHSGHRDAEQARSAATPTGAPAAASDYLDVPGERFGCSGMQAVDWPRTLECLDRFWRAE